MNIRNLKVKIAVATLLCLAFFVVALPANAALVTCGTKSLDVPGTPEVEGICTVCDILVLVKNVIDVISFRLVPIFATLLFLIAGFLILLSGASPEMTSAGKSMFKNTIIGVVIIYLSWLAANTVIKVIAGGNDVATSWYKLDCAGGTFSNASAPLGPAAPSGAVWRPPNVISGVSLSDARAREYLNSRGNGQIKHDGILPCSEAVRNRCGSFEGVKQTTLDEMIRLQQGCGCYIVINDATGPGHDANAGHTTGNKIDIQHSSTLDAYIRQFPQDPGHPGDARYFKNPQTGAVYFNENTAHWDIYVP